MQYTCDVDSTYSSSKTAKFSSPTEDEQKQFFCSLASIPDVKSAILSLVSPHYELYVLATDLPLPLSDLLWKEYLSSVYYELAIDTDISIIHSQVTSVELQTREQANCRQAVVSERSGRITASKFKSVCHSLSLIISICHREKLCFKHL